MTETKRFAVWAVLVLVGCGGRGADVGPGAAAGAEAPGRPSVLEVVHEQVEAFNRHDPEGVAALVAPDFVWLAVAGEEVTVEVRGRAALVEGMRGYFASVPSVRSEVEESLVSGSLVAVRERATWTDGSGAERSQVALGIYEIREGLIQRVWYYPAER